MKTSHSGRHLKLQLRVPKESKYEELVTVARRNGFDATLITIEVGSRGVPGFKKLKQTIPSPIENMTTHNERYN